MSTVARESSKLEDRVRFSVPASGENMLFNLSKIRPCVYLLSFDSRFELAMHFLRAQEYFECPNPDFRGKSFKLLDYIDWYSKTHGSGAFTYANDWYGFNVPSEALNHLYIYSSPEIRLDWTTRDKFMAELTYFLNKLEDNKKFYLMGIKTGDKDTLEHELAHALYYIDDTYREQQQINLANLSDEDQKKCSRVLHKMAYAEDVWEDEAQAYFSTGKCGLLHEAFTNKKWKQMAAPFVSTFKKHK